VTRVRDDQRADAGLVETVERDALDQAIAPQVGEQLGKRMIASDLGFAVGPDDEEGRLPRRSEDVPKEVDGGSVGPVEIVQHE
jgi:hypothetical protein